MIVVGLTGSIAMGKSETAGMFASLGIPVFNADMAVHRLYASNGAAVMPVANAFPDVLRNGGIDRELLSQRLRETKDGFARIEAIVHPLVRAEQERFLKESTAAGHRMAVLDIPLLYETGRDKDMDFVVVVTAPADVQRARVLARPGMTEEKFAAILARQMPDAEKRRKADFLVDTGRGREPAFAQVKQIIDALSSKDERTHA